MTSIGELKEFGNTVEETTKGMQTQLGNIIRSALPLSSIIALVSAIGLPAALNVLPLWVPTAFILWLGLCVLSVVEPIGGSLGSKPDKVFRDYGKLSGRHKTIGIETVAKRLVPLSQASAAIYAVSAVILLLAGAGVIKTQEYFSAWMPLTADILLTALLLGGPPVYRRLTASQLDQTANIYRNREDVVKRIQSRPAVGMLLLLGVLALMALVGFVYFVMPIRALSATFGLYRSDLNWYLVSIILILQVVSSLLLYGWLSQILARQEITNSITNLSSVSWRIRQMVETNRVSDNDMSSLRNQYYNTVKYRFIQQHMLGFIPHYVPVLTEAYLRSDVK